MTTLPPTPPVAPACQEPGRGDDPAAAGVAGSSPIEASSGQITRHRLNRGGDRALNRAIHIIATTRMRDDPTTRAYLTRRRAEGKSPREIRRCLIGGLSVVRPARAVVPRSRRGMATLPCRCDGQL
jgi:hypothetical protein